MLTLTEISEEIISKIHEIEKQQYFLDAQRTGKFIIDFEKHVEPILNDEISKNNIKIDDDDGRFDDKIEKMDIASLIKKLLPHLQNKIIQQTLNISNDTIIKPEIRLINVPKDYYRSLSDIGAENIGKLIKTHGTIIAMEDNQTIPYIGVFECRACMRIHHVEQNSIGLHEPALCSECGGRAFKFLEEESKFIDFKSIILEENDNTKTQQSRIKVELKGKLTKDVDLNDEITVIGFSERDNQINNYGNHGPIAKNKIVANNVKLKEDNSIVLKKQDIHEIRGLQNKYGEDIIEVLIESLAPSIFYPKEIKKALLCYLVKGSVGANGSRRNIHILIVGDPGTGKSKLSRQIIQLADTFTIAEGTASTGVGLTASVVSEPLLNTNVLELGAFPKAHGGHCYIDEFDKLSKEEQQILLNATEEGAMNFNKSGVHKKIETDVALLATGNPKYDRFDPYKSLKDQFNMVDTMLSRFDLIFIREDKPNIERDTEIAKHILTPASIADDSAAITASRDMIINENLLKKYLTYASQINPQLTEEAQKYLIQIYPKIRNEADNNDDVIKSDTRMLESFTRIGSAISKLKLKKEVTIREIREAIELVKYSFNEVGQDIGNLRGYSTNKEKENRDRILSIIVDEDKNTVTTGVQQKIILEKAKEELNIGNSNVLDRLRELETHNDIYRIKEVRNIYYKPKSNY